MPSLHVLPVSCDCLYPSLYRHKPFCLQTHCALWCPLPTSDSWGEIALSFGSSREGSWTDGDTRMGGEQMDLTSPKSVYVRRRGPRGRQMKRNVNQGTFFWQGTGHLLEGHFPVLFPVPHSSPHTWRTGLAPWLSPSEALFASGLGSGIFLPPVFQEVLSKLLFPYVKPTTAGQPKDRRKQKNFRCHFLTRTKVLDCSHQLMPLELQPNSSLRLFDTILRIPDRCSVRKDATN